MNVTYDVKAVVNANGKNIPALGSPTSNLRVDTTYAFYSGISLSRISSIKLVDTGNNERDSTSSITITRVAGNRFTVSGSINATAAYTVSKVRLYSSNNYAYFDTTLPNAISVNYGTPITVTVDITIGLNVSLLNMFVDGTYTETITQIIADVLTGAASSSALRIGDITVSGTASVSGLNLQISKPNDFTVIARKTFNVTSDGSIDTINLVSVGGRNLLSVSKSNTFTAGNAFVPVFTINT